MCSDYYIITEHVIALLKLCVASSLNAEIGLRREKMLLYDQPVRVLKRMDGLEDRP